MRLKPIKVFYHDDPPCEAKLDSTGTCTACGIHPDMQSTIYRYHCPTCNSKLTTIVEWTTIEFHCPKCKFVSIEEKK